MAPSLPFHAHGFGPGLMAAGPAGCVPFHGAGKGGTPAGERAATLPRLVEVPFNQRITS